jgi:2-keto-4-pentenoate hydratase/2-oxohepta-3-ene-1,7-dioic acid hydratase in catechol pathway
MRVVFVCVLIPFVCVCVCTPSDPLPCVCVCTPSGPLPQAKGLPWCVAKGYDTFLPHSELVDASAVHDHTALTLWLDVNGERRQTCTVDEMIFKLPFLIQYISNIFTLEEGDMIITGTPEGVAAVFPGDVMTAGVEGMPAFDMSVNVEE